MVELVSIGHVESSVSVAIVALCSSSVEPQNLDVIRSSG